MIVGVNGPRLDSWIKENIPGVELPLRFEQIGGGRSNLTFRITDARGEVCVLRRPPLGQVLSTAHDMGREWRAITALSMTAVPVPQPLAFCEDQEVIGAPFYMMAYVQGLVLRDTDVALSLSRQARRSCSRSLVDVLATLHSLDPDEVGLGNHGRRDGYVVRQLHRWYRQWKESRVRDSRLIDELYVDLLGGAPAQGLPTLVHGDFRLDNAIVDDSGTVKAVLDWELSTLGDPLADLAWLLVHWDDTSAPTGVGGFLEINEVLDLYEGQSHRDLREIQFYIAFSHWRLACILEGVYSRYLGKVMGTEDVSPETFAKEAERRAEASRMALDSPSTGSI